MPWAREPSGVAEELARTEIHQDDPPPIVSAHHVLRFHIAMNELGLMHGSQRSTHLLADADRFASAHSSSRDPRCERLAVDEVHPEADATVVTIGSMNGDDVDVTNARELARFVQEI